MVSTRDEIGELAAAFVSLGNQLLGQTLRARAIFDGAGDEIITINESGHIEEMNPAAEAIFGYRWDELAGKKIDLLMPPDDAAAGDTTLVKSQKREGHGRSKDGSTVPVEISVSKNDYDGGRHFIGVVRDVSARHAAQLRQQELVEALERSNAELDKFAYIASHDLKAPLRVIDNASRWLEEDLEPHLTDDTRESMQLLRSRVRRMEHLLDDMLLHSRIGRVEERATLVNGAELMADVAELVHLPPGFELVICPRFFEIEVPNMPITTVFLNLIYNAVKHHDRDTGRIEVGVLANDDGFEFSIKDDGPGIRDEYQSKIFEMFQTLKPRDQVDGSGMGLAIVKKHVVLAGGQIEVIPCQGRGVEFRIF